MRSIRIVASGGEILRTPKQENKTRHRRVQVTFNSNKINLHNLFSKCPDVIRFKSTTTADVADAHVISCACVVMHLPSRHQTTFHCFTWEWKWGKAQTYDKFIYSTYITSTENLKFRYGIYYLRERRCWPWVERNSQFLTLDYELEISNACWWGQNPQINYHVH